MRVLYDGHIYIVNATGGISRYFANLIGRFPNNFKPLLITCKNSEFIQPQHPNLSKFNYMRYGFRPGRVSYWLEKHYFRTIQAWSKPDILHPTYYRLLTRQNFREVRIPIVLSVWDMIHERYPEQLDPHGYTAIAKREAIEAASVIICISESTKSDLLERYTIPEDRVFVTHLASSIDATMSYGGESVPESPYFLYVGRRDSYKNYSTLLHAFSKVAQSHKDISLCVVGPMLTSEEQKQIDDLGIRENMIVFGHIDDRHLAKLYRCSLAFVYPSLYEGFGIPPIEAMSCGTVVVAANTSSIPEVVADAGVLFDPTAVDELADILLWLANFPSERNSLIDKGYARAQEFSWDKTVAKTIEIYQSVAR